MFTLFNVYTAACRKSFLSALFSLSIFAFTNPSFSQSKLEKEIKSDAKHITGNLGVYAEVLETGQTFSYNGDKRFPMQSVYKFPIAVAVLHVVDQGKLKLYQTVHINKNEYIPANGHSPVRDLFPNGTDITIRELLRYSVSESDGSASDALLKAIAGIEIANKYIHQIGIKDMNIAITEKVQVVNDNIQYQNYATPKAITNLLKLFYTQHILTQGSKAVLLKDMIESSPGQHRLKGLLPKGTVVAHKTGTANTMKDGITKATNDVGIIKLPNGKHLAISVFLSNSYSKEDQRELAIAKAAKAAFDFYNH